MRWGIVLLLLLPIVVADPLDTSRPTVNITFHEEPVTLEYWILEYDPPLGYLPSQFSTVEQRNELAGGFHEFIFSYEGSIEALYDGNYLLIGDFQDLDGNPQTVQVAFEIDTGSMPMWLVTPSNQYLYQSTIGAADTTSFTFEAGYDNLQYPNLEECKYGFEVAGFNPSDLAYEFNRLPNFMTIAEVLFHDAFIFPVTLLENEEIPTHVICKEVLPQSGETKYHHQPFTLSYDETDPIITASLSTNPIIDWNHRSTVLTIETDDNTVCLVENTVFPEGLQHNIRDSPIFLFDKYEDFVTTRDITLGFLGTINNEILEPLVSGLGQHYYEFTVTCENLAGRTTEQIVGLTIDLEDILDFEALNYEMYQQTTSFTLEIETNIEALSCVLVDDTQYSMNQDSQNTLLWTYDFTVEEGSYTYEVTCATTDKSATKEYTYVVDLLPPDAPTVDVPTALCSEDGFIVSFESEDITSGIDEYNITIGDFTDTTSQEELLLFPNSLGFEIDETYTIEVFATDNAGLDSSTTSVSTTYRDPSHEDCDNDPPTTGHELVERSDGFDITIYCEDEKSGCSTSYDLFRSTTEFVCPEDGYTPSTLTDNSGRLEETLFVGETEFLCWIVYNNAGLSATSSVTLDATVGIDLLLPEFGISGEKTFLLHITTVRDAECRQGEYLSAYDAMNDEQRYNALVAKGDSSLFDATGLVDHTIDAFSDLSRDDDAYTDDWLVACQSDSIYSSTQLTIGYDTTPPVIDAYADPNPLQEPVDLSTQMHIDLDEDSLCTYLQPNIPPYDPAGGEFTFFDPVDFTNRDQYLPSYTTRLPEDDLLVFMTSTYTVYSYFISCTNLGGHSADQGLDIIVDPINTMAVTINTPSQVNSQTVLVDVNTVLEATCSYSFNGETLVDLSTSDNKIHTATATLEEGEHDLFVTCESIHSDQLQGTAEKEITIDSIPPTVPLVTITTPTCSLTDTVTVRFQSEDDGIDYYEYEVTQDLTETFISYTDLVDLPLEYPLEDGSTISVRGRAFDYAGNEGSWSGSETIEVTTEDHVSCDFIPPIGWADVVDTPEGADVSIFCTDTESGCTETYGYKIIDQSEACDETYSYNAYDESITILDDQAVCWQVSDNAGNTAEGLVDVSVSLDISISSPNFGVGSTQTYNLIFETTRSADCRLGFISPNHPETLPDWYDQLQDSFDTTGGASHSINDFNIIDFGASACSGLDECTQQMVVICTENSRYHYNIFDIGYDSSPPVITTLIDPNPVIEPQDLQATLFVEADDPVWCSFEDDAGNSYAFYQYPDINDPEQYLEELEKFLGYFSPPAIGETYDVIYTTTCVNFAEQIVESIDTVTIAPTNEITITINTEALQGVRTVTLDVTTDLASTCTYKFDPGHPGWTFSSTGGTDHLSDYTFSEDDVYELIVSCDAISGPFTASVSKELTVDASGPLMNDILANDYSCSLTELAATFMSDAEVVGLKEYSYSILDSEGNFLVDWKEISSDGTQDVVEELELVSGSVYTWQAQAIDNLDRESSIISKAVEATDQDHPSCDFTNPVASITSEYVYGGIEITVGCTDNGGCTDYYDYEFTSDVCVESFTTLAYADKPVFEDSSGMSCARVYDYAGLSDDVDISYDIINYCSNGIQDPDEEGIDCGGPCPANCLLCSNGIQDPLEEGVDCGGVCPQSCDQTCGNGVVDPGEECDSFIDGLTCGDFGFIGGQLSCTDSCEIDTGSCEPQNTGFCGDGVVDPGEECDGSVDMVCEDFGLTSGSLSCSDTCEISTLSCEGATGFCGDGLIGVGEECDGTLLELSCEDFGLVSGELGCSSCGVDTSTCYSGFCGDGEIDQGETCDGLAWGPVLDCSDISPNMNGIPSCGFDCHFDTSSCVLGEIVEECSFNADCPLGSICVGGECIEEEEPIDYDADSDGDGLPDWWEEEYFDCETCAEASDDPDEDQSTNLEEYFAGTHPLSPSTSPEKKTLPLILLIIGVVFILGGSGYLVYDYYGRKEEPLPETVPETPREDPEIARKNAALLEERKKLQEETRAKNQEVKAQQRKELLSSFKGKEPVPKPKKPVPKGDSFKKLDSLAKDEGEVFKKLDKIKPKTQEVFSKLSELSGSSKNKIKTTVNKPDTKPKEMLDLFKDAEKKNVTPKQLTPVLKHLIDKGKIEHNVAHKTVHHLHKNDLLTEKQRDKVIADLKAHKEKTA